MEKKGDAEVEADRHGHVLARLTRASNLLEAVWKVFSRSALFFGLVVAVGFVAVTMTDRAVVLEPPRVPKALADRGYSDQVLAGLIEDRILHVQQQAATSKERLLELGKDQFTDFAVPGFGLSVKAMAGFLRRALGLHGTRVETTVTCATPACATDELGLLVMVSKDKARRVEFDEVECHRIESLPLCAALTILWDQDAYLVPSYFYGSGQVARAEKFAQKLVESDHKDKAWALNLIGVIELVANNRKAAITRFCESLDADDRHMLAHANLGKVLRQTGNLDAAEAHLKEAILLDSDNAMVNNTYALLLRDRDDLDGALEKHRKAVASRPELASYRIDWGNTLVRKGEAEGDRQYIEDAIDEFKTARKLAPDEPVLYIHWGIAYHRWAAILKRNKNTNAANEKFDEAIEQYEKAVSLDPESSEAKNNIRVAKSDKASLFGGVKFGNRAKKMAAKDRSDPC